MPRPGSGLGHARRRRYTGPPVDTRSAVQVAECNQGGKAPLRPSRSEPRPRMSGASERIGAVPKRTRAGVSSWHEGRRSSRAWSLPPKVAGPPRALHRGEPPSGDRCAEAARVPGGRQRGGSVSGRPSVHDNLGSWSVREGGSVGLVENPALPGRQALVDRDSGQAIRADRGREAHREREQGHSRSLTASGAASVARLNLASSPARPCGPCSPRASSRSPSLRPL